MTNNKMKSTRRKTMIMITLCVIHILWGMTYSFSVSFFPRVAIKHGLRIFEVGIVLAMSPFAGFITSSFWSILLPSTGAKHMFWAGMTLEGGCVILLGALCYIYDRITFLVLAIILQFFQGTGASMQDVVVESTVMVIYRDNIASAKGFLETFAGIGYAIGPLIGAGLYHAGGYPLPYNVIGGITIVAASLATCVLPNVGDKRAAPWKSMIKLAKSPYIILLCLGVFISVSTQSFLETNYSVYLKIFHVGIVKSATILLLIAVFYAITGMIVGFAAEYFGYRKFIISGLFLAVVGLQLNASFPYWHIQPKLWHFIVGTSIIGVSLGAVMMPVSAEVVQYARFINIPLNNSKTDIGDDLGVYSSVSGLLQISRSLGMICGPSVGSTLTSIPTIGYSWTASIFGFVTLLLLLIFTVYIIFEKKWQSVNSTKVIDDSGTYEKLPSIEEIEENPAYLKDDDESSSMELKIAKDIVKINK
ncbi:uncharacterized protein TRIADDRAFT_58954 [Trichoplax adhaerens]|uniref:Major facilitator superfamily (MFS) profile domain-containing protein n=1 Tax=Trichoplax adhaerens TaxID=10228 RepID=B3S450_TRIAD|nr:hypothetical protein TRIADDRAFT_58954 [Trichoplax adhaerens]EDV22579.1 hypothetical protein TRIADDRAFT_58954 [Trichoplax adhaerens]|eukprot:XP_002115123.1 hypothetical protein TRIADDRAFT_58954 [Trichoplax adhaerens]